MATYKLRLPQSPFIGEIVLCLGVAYVLILLVRIFYNQTVVIEYTDNEIILQIG